MIFQDLVELYVKTIDNYKFVDNILTKRLLKKQFSNAEVYDTEVKCYEKFGKDLKMILKNNFGQEIIKEVLSLEKEYEKESIINSRIAETYGSELSGDYNEKENKLRNKLRLLQNILK